jgi:long-chain acyl-CoA synthetase
VRLIHELVDYAARQYGDAPFVLRHGAGGWEGYSFREAARAVHAFRLLLEREGVRPGDRVGIQSENRPEWGLAYLAVLAAGAVAVPLDAQLKAQEVGEILATAGARLAVVSTRHRATVEAAAASRTIALRLVSLDPAADLPHWEEALRLWPDAEAGPAHGSPGDLAVLIFTSGTTGQAKGVMLSHANILTNVEGVARTIECGPGDRLLSILPLHHTFESTIGLLSPLRVGGSIAYARGLDSKQLREDMATSQATIFVAVPLLYEKLLAAIVRGIDALPGPRRWLVRTLLAVTRILRAATGARVGRTLLRAVRVKAGLGRIRMFATGAAPLAPEVFWGFIDLGIPMVEGYGLTETSPVVCLNRPHEPHPGAVGWPLMGVEVRIDAPDGEGNGEILIRGPNVMLGYYGDGAATAEAIRQGWFHTGDLGRALPDGRIAITGRLKNMIATAAGKKIYPEEVEVQLAASPWITEVVVLGGRDARGEREEVHAHVYPDRVALEAHARATGRTFDEAFVEATVRAEVDARCEALAPYKRVRKVVVRAEEFPKTTTGKIRRLGLGAAAAAAAPEAATR